MTASLALSSDTPSVPAMRVERKLLFMTAYTSNPLKFDATRLASGPSTRQKKTPRAVPRALGYSEGGESLFRNATIEYHILSLFT